MKPVRLPASATRALPRWALFALGLLYILTGLIGRDPWKTDDAAGFGIMWTMAHGGVNDWLWPHIAGMPAAAEGPLACWLGALCIKLFGGLLGDALASRIATVLFFLVGALSIWHATFLLARRSEAQPQQLAFGGQPEPDDFGRTLADGALLIYLGSLGLLLRSHETSAEALQVSLIAFLLFANARYFQFPDIRHAGMIGIALGALGLTRGWVVPLGLWLFLVPALKWLGVEGRKLTTHYVFALAVAIVVLMLWLTTAAWIRPFNSSPYDAWMMWNYGEWGKPRLATLLYLLRFGVWYFWPAWPFAAWAIYAWRRQYNAVHIGLPLTFFACLTFLACINWHQEESILLPLLPPLCVLAAFGLPTMKRNAINAVDWFSVMTLTASALFIWIGWIAKQTGWPAKLAQNAFKLAPGFKPEFNLLAFVVALAATAGWILLVHWRISRRPSVLWRAVVLSSGGVILCWVLLTTLWLPWLNYGKSYAGVAHQIAARLPQVVSCVDSNVGPAQRASFAYLGNIPFSRFDGAQCDFLLLQDNSKATIRIPKQFSAHQWELLWDGHRPSDRDERFLLFRRFD